MSSDQGASLTPYQGRVVQVSFGFKVGWSIEVKSWFGAPQRARITAGDVIDPNVLNAHLHAAGLHPVKVEEQESRCLVVFASQTQPDVNGRVLLEVMRRYYDRHKGRPFAWELGRR